MRLRPIPKSLLQDKCSYSEYVKDSGEGSEFLPSLELKNIRIDEQKQFSYSNNGKEIIGNAILFYDVVNSTGLKRQFVMESKINFNNREYTIKDIDILKEFDKVHHYEVLLK